MTEEEIKEVQKVFPEAMKRARIQIVTSENDDRFILEKLLRVERLLTKLIIEKQIKIKEQCISEKDQNQK